MLFWCHIDRQFLYTNSLSLNIWFLVITKSELVKQIFLAQCFLSIHIVGSALRLFVLLFVVDEQFLNFLVYHLLSLGLFLFWLLAVEQCRWLDAEFRSIIFKLFQESQLWTALLAISNRWKGSWLIFLRLLHIVDHGAELQNLRVGGHTPAHCKSHLHVVGLLLRHADTAGRSLD